MNARPTDLELRVLRRLWALGNVGSVRQILEGWTDTPVPGYTTVLKVLQIMEPKGLVTHRKAGRAYRYVARLRSEDLSRSRLRELVKGFFQGDGVRLVNALVDEMDLSAQEIREVRRMLDAKARAKE